MISTFYEQKTPLILIADDSLLERISLRDFLKAEGYEVAEACNGAEAVTQFHALSPDIVLLDFIMPEMDGITACRRIKGISAGEKIAVFMITSIADEESVDMAYEAGATDYINKPVNHAVLRQRIKRALEAQQTAKDLDHSNAFSESIISHSLEGIVTINAAQKIKYINPAVSRIFNFSEAQLKGADLSVIMPTFNIHDYDDQWLTKILSDTPQEMNGLKGDGGQLPLEVTVGRFQAEGQTYYSLTIRDISSRKSYEEKIQYQAFYDSLTGLPNRVFLKERMSFEIARARRNNTKFAILYLDLDRFKVINDTLGHETGDLLIKELANRLKLAIRTDDLVARMGGDEFVILLPGLFHVELVGKIASKILDTVKQPMVIDGKKLNLSISIGITIFPDDAQDSEMLLTYADIAMYRAKENGKDTFQAFTQELNTRAVERLDLENGLRQAVENNEFVVFYQPKVNTKSLQIVGMEALVRWQHPTLGLISPMSFIPVAEETGLIVPIGAWVLRTACTHNQSLVAEGLPPLTIAVNLSMRQFEAQDMVETVTTILEETGMSPEYLELEITESIAVKNAHYTVSVIQELQKIGVTFSIDDFGTGYSSLSQINSLSVDKLKIDKSFVSPIDGVKENSIIASTVLTLGKNLNMLVIAEGVETQAQVDFFTDNDCDEMQGYFIAKPMTWESFKKLYLENLGRIIPVKPEIQ